MHFMLSKTFPFSGLNNEEVLNKIKKDLMNLNGEIWSKISENAKDFIRMLLIKNPDNRMTT